MVIGLYIYLYVFILYPLSSPLIELKLASRSFLTLPYYTGFCTGRTARGL